MASLKVLWCLKGALMTNLVTALCLSPGLRGDMSLAHRCENALTGHLCLDLFSLLADDICQQMKLPRGSTFLAPQTVSSLQSCALNTALLCFTKDTGFSPWSKGAGSLCELPIEHFFGRLRCQQANAQLTSRQFLHAGARDACQMSKKLNSRRKMDHGHPETCLSESEFLAIWLRPKT